MHGEEVGQFMPCVMGFLRSLYAQSLAGQVEQWWPDIPLLCQMNWLLLSLNGCGRNDRNLQGDFKESDDSFIV
jgi:hypothetical protein